MFNKFLKKIFGQKDSESIENKGPILEEKSGKIANFIKEKSEAFQNEILEIREKFKNLRETNYNLGIKHLENGQLIDATLRFRIIKKLWPDCFDAYYQLGYCLILKNKPLAAKKIIEELLAKDPNYDPKAKELLSHIETSIQNTALGE